MLKLLCVGDPHYGRTPSYLRPGFWRKCVTNMLLAALENATRAKVDAIVILGDIFDNNNPSPKDHAEFVDFCFRAKEADVKVIIFTGNHDYEDADSNALEPYARMRGMVTVIEKATTLNLKGIPTKFYPFTPPDVSPDLGKIKTKTPHLIFHHTMIKGSMTDNGWLADGFEPDNKHFYVGGHLHTWQLLGKRAIYPGTALVHHYNHNPKGFTIIKAELENKKLRVQHTQLDYTPPFWLRDITLAEYLRVRKKDKARQVYYKLRISPEDKVPDDKRIIDFIREGSKVTKKEKAKVTGSKLDKLPNPMSWLISQFEESQRDKVREIFNSVKLPRSHMTDG